jgi:hypothetical protein
LTDIQPYAGHLRDDHAGFDSARGIPPAQIAHIDRALNTSLRKKLRQASWITNGLWGVISRCWILEPSLRPNATGFLQVLKGLEGRTENWLPSTVNDLAGKVKLVAPNDDTAWMATYITFWK